MNQQPNNSGHLATGVDNS